jgi:hypothetical protein
MMTVLTTRLESNDQFQQFSNPNCCSEQLRANNGADLEKLHGSI